MLKVRHAAVMLAFAAMAFCALVPTGWMPNPQGMGEAAFIICGMDWLDMPGMDMSQMPGMDMSTMDVSKSGDQDLARHSDDGHRHEGCPFAASPHLATPSVVATLALPALVDRFRRDLLRAPLAFALRQYAAQSPRAPPSLA